jgi:hypothetical protein
VAHRHSNGTYIIQRKHNLKGSENNVVHCECRKLYQETVQNVGKIKVSYKENKVNFKKAIVNSPNTLNDTEQK